MAVKIDFNFEEWFKYNNKLIQDLKERIFDKDNKQQLTERNNNK